jgi:hypothetical protein
MRIRFVVTPDRVHVYASQDADVEVETVSLPVSFHTLEQGGQPRRIDTLHTQTNERTDDLRTPERDTQGQSTSPQLPPSQADYLEQALRKHGPLSTADLAQKAVEFGFTTSAHNIVTAVRKVAHRERRFTRTPDGQFWTLSGGLPGRDFPYQPPLVTNNEASLSEQGESTLEQVEDGE